MVDLQFVRESEVLIHEVPVHRARHRLVALEDMSWRSELPFLVVEGCILARGLADPDLQAIVQDDFMGMI